MTFLHKTNLHSLIVRMLFCALLGTLVIVHLFGNFKGITHREAMEQAQIGREILRGNGNTSKVHHPVILYKAVNDEEPIDLTQHHNTYYAPLYPYINAGVLALIDGANTEKHKVGVNQMIYLPDRALALASLVFLLIAILINYFFAKQLFDKTIATTTALITLLSGGIWTYVQSCLPQMFLLMIFSMILYTIYLAFQKFEQTQTTPWKHLIACAFLFGILALTKWLTLWIFLGYLIFILIHFKPKGIVAIASILVVTLMISPALYFNFKHYGNPLGAASLSIMNGITGDEEQLLRNFGKTNLKLETLFLSMATRCFEQFQNIISFMGGAIVAPLFLLGLLHPYKRNTHNTFKYGIVLMWLPAVIGMAIFGLSPVENDSNQLHLLFMPVMVMFGVSIVALMWNRLSISRTKTMFANAHLLIIFILCSGTSLTALPKQIIDTFENQGRGKDGSPYYHPAELSTLLYDKAREYGDQENPAIISDQPAAAAWYADVHAIWMPLTPKDFVTIENLAQEQDIPIAGIHTTAVSLQHLYANQKNAQIMALTHLPFTGVLTGIQFSPSTKVLSQDPNWGDIPELFDKPLQLQRSRRLTSYGHQVFHARKKMDESK